MGKRGTNRLLSAARAPPKPRLGHGCAACWACDSGSDAPPRSGNRKLFAVMYARGEPCVCLPDPVFSSTIGRRIRLSGPPAALFPMEFEIGKRRLEGYIFFSQQLPSPRPYLGSVKRLWFRHQPSSLWHLAARNPPRWDRMQIELQAPGPMVQTFYLAVVWGIACLPPPRCPALQAFHHVWAYATCS